MPKAPKSSSLKAKVIHPHSRTAAQLSKRVHYDKKVDRHNSDKAVKIGLLGDKLGWFHENLNKTKTVYTKEELHDLVLRYLSRFDEELEQIAIKQSLSKHRSQQHVARQQTVIMTTERERRQYESEGLEIPDLLNSKNVRKFREWTREMRYIQNIGLMRLKGVKASSTLAAEDQTSKVQADEGQTNQSQVKSTDVELEASRKTLTEEISLPVDPDSPETM